jgi:hypothetical protein
VTSGGFGVSPPGLVGLSHPNITSNALIRPKKTLSFSYEPLLGNMLAAVQTAFRKHGEGCALVRAQKEEQTKKTAGIALSGGWQLRFFGRGYIKSMGGGGGGGVKNKIGVVKKRYRFVGCFERWGTRNN